MLKTFLQLYGTLVVRNLAYSTSTTAMAAHMRAVRIKSFGDPSQLYIEDQEPIPQLASNHDVLLHVAATALNRADTLQRKGGYNPPKGASDILGLEASGVIEKIGSNVQGFKEGDRVMALLAGMDYISAAAIPEVWLTAYQLLHKVSAIQPNERVLVHAAGSGVGTAAIQLIKGLPGTQVIATAGSAAKLEKAKSLGADVLVNYKEEKFSERVMDATNKQGVDIILDPVGGSNVDQNLASIAMDGRWVLYGLMGGPKASNDKFLALMLRKRVQLLSSTLRARSLDYKKDLVDSFENHALEKFVSGEYKPIIDSITTLDGVADAHRRMDANLNSGKIIMKVSDSLLAKDEL
eukprot:TCONS_00052361-protein